MARLVGIGGKLASGKDTVADYLVDKHGWIKMGMSDPLNNALLTLDPVIPFKAEAYEGVDGVWLPNVEFGELRIGTVHAPYSEVHKALGYTEAKTIPEVRRLLQVLGTEVGRNMIDQNVWVNIARHNAETHLAEGRNVILTGIRFDNEVAMIRDVPEGELWGVVRPSQDTTGAVAVHASETSVDYESFDRVILNDGSLHDLYQKVESLING